MLQSVADVTVVTRSMTATENAKTDQLATQNSSESITEEKMSTDIAENNFLLQRFWQMWATFSMKTRRHWKPLVARH